jgi:TolB-like protein
MEPKISPGRGVSTTPIMRFGAFELDLRAAELRKHGRKIRLQEQPFQILVELLKRPGQVVLREEIRHKLWPNGTIVEFEHSINAAVKRLRDSLQDSAERPRYIETLARRGYRFIAAVFYESEAASKTEAVNSIAVLPFANTSGDQDNEYFSDGLSEEIINELSRVRGLKVIARTSAFAFKGKQDDIRKIASALNVAHIVEGSVRRVGTRVRITAQLVAANVGTHLWSERYDREIADIFAVQNEIAQSIAAVLRVHLSFPSKQYIPKLSAYEAYLKARYCLAAFTRDSLPRSRDFYEQAIEADSGFAQAHSGLAMALVSVVLPGIIAAHDAMPIAKDAARKALELEPASQEAQAVLGMVAALYDLNWTEAERRFQLALTGDPVPAYVRWYYSFSYLIPMARTQEAVQQCTRGLQDDPLNFLGEFHFASALLAGGKTEDGEAHLRRVSEVHSNLYQPYYLLALSQSVRGLHEEAVSAAEKAYSLAPWSTTTRGLFAGLLKFAGQTTLAEQLRDRLPCEDHYGAAMGLSLFNIGCAEIELAAHWAQKAAEQRDTRIILLIALLRAFRPNLFLSETKWAAVARGSGIPTLLFEN